jgi:hypothetical protein
VIVLLPLHFDIKEIATTLGQFKHDLPITNYAVELERIVINSRLEYKILYTGNVGQVSPSRVHVDKSC